MKKLKIEDGEQVILRNVKLPNATFVKFQPISPLWNSIDEVNRKSVYFMYSFITQLFRVDQKINCAIINHLQNKIQLQLITIISSFILECWSYNLIMLFVFISCLHPIQVSITNTDIEVDITDVPEDLRSSVDIQTLKLSDKITETVKIGNPFHFQFSNKDKDAIISIQVR